MPLNRPKAKNFRIFISATLALLLAACASTAPAPPAKPVGEDDSYFREALHWSRNSAEHRAVFEQTYEFAARRVEELAAGRERGTWAVSLDADETLIDNSQYQLEIGRRGESFGPESWNEWVQKGVAPALPGAVNFTRRVKQLGGIVAVVTNRRTHQCAATAGNLQLVGIIYDVVLCRQVGHDGEKEPRWEAVQAGTTTEWPDAQISGAWTPHAVDVVLWVGDNIGDFPDQTQDFRNDPSSESDFGSRFFALPNPMYGSWEANPKE